MKKFIVSLLFFGIIGFAFGCERDFVLGPTGVQGINTNTNSSNIQTQTDYDELCPGEQIPCRNHESISPPLLPKTWNANYNQILLIKEVIDMFYLGGYGEHYVRGKYYEACCWTICGRPAYKSYSMMLPGRGGYYHIIFTRVMTPDEWPRFGGSVVPGITYNVSSEDNYEIDLVNDLSQSEKEFHAQAIKDLLDYGWNATAQSDRWWRTCPKGGRYGPGDRYFCSYNNNPESHYFGWRSAYLALASPCSAPLDYEWKIRIRFHYRKKNFTPDIEFFQPPLENPATDG